MPDLSHVGPGGEARMVDVSAKAVSARVARAAGTIRMTAEALAAIRDNAVTKGDVLTVAKVAGVLAAKRTAELVPLCHPLPLSDVQVLLAIDETVPAIHAEATVRTTASTGVEMEAITAVAVTLITVYDMAKSLDKGMVITDIRLLEKSGGRSGMWKSR